MENNKYNRGKEILLQASLARKGERAGQGKGEGGEKGKERNQWLLIFTPRLCMMVVYVVETHSGQ